MPATRTYEAEARFDVKLARPLKIDGVTLSHVPEYRMSGARVNAIVAEYGEDAIARAEPAPAEPGDSDVGA